MTTREEQLRMLLHPERYTDGQLDQMLEETGIPVPDTQKEWGRFRRRVGRNRVTYKVAAVFVGLLMLSGISYATVRIATHTGEKPKVAVTDRKPDVRKVKKAYGSEAAPTRKAPVIYNNVELQQIMRYIADGYGVDIVFKNEAARSLRFYLQWEADDTLQEIIDRINHFEKVHLTLTDETVTIE